jgi:hypothetical protein
MDNVIFKVIILAGAPLLGMAVGKQIKNKRLSVTLTFLTLTIGTIGVYPVFFTDYSYTSNALDILARFLFLFAAGLIVEQFINHVKAKKLIVILTSVLICIATAFNEGLKGLGSAFEQNKQLIEKWNVDNFQIQQYRTIGFAGPYNKEYYLRKFQLNHWFVKTIWTPENKNDSCVVDFYEELGARITRFNKCDITIVEVDNNVLQQ